MSQAANGLPTPALGPWAHEGAAGRQDLCVADAQSLSQVRSQAGLALRTKEPQNRGLSLDGQSSRWVGQEGQFWRPQLWGHIRGLIFPDSNQTAPSATTALGGSGHCTRLGEEQQGLPLPTVCTPHPEGPWRRGGAGWTGSGAQEGPGAPGKGQGEGQGAAGAGWMVETQAGAREEGQ